MKSKLNKKDWLQVNAFKTIFRQNLRLGQMPQQAFVDAIVTTSDEMFKNADSKLIKKYLG